MARPFKYTGKEIDKLYKDYVADLKNQFYIKMDFIKTGDRVGEPIEIKVFEPQTIEGFCLFIGISLVTFNKYANKGNEDIEDDLINFVDSDNDNDSNEIKRGLIKSLTRVQTMIKKHQLGGGLNGLYNQQIVSRINGLSDKQEIEVTQQIQSIVLPVPTK